jgi:hypothetical protein
MPLGRPTRLAAAVILAAGALVAAPAGASAAATTSSASTHVLRTDVTINKFINTPAGVKALGTATTNLAAGESRKKVTLTVAQTNTCSILTLSLAPLHLQLLGLIVDTSAINLKITGRRGAVLGDLFCSLSRGLKLGKAATVRRATASLNRYMKGHPMHVLRMRIHVSPAVAQAAQAPAVCDVLDLVIGPLHLDLLGLVVDLYGPTPTKPVEVHITANPAGGILGSLLCNLANNAPASTATPATPVTP